MKLRNKKTGEIIEFDAILAVKDVAGDSVAHLEYGSLAELNKEWEDYEEPKTYYYISDFGAIREGDVGKFVEDEIARKEISNYFETKEEAEKAVEKLKAIKILKDYDLHIEWANTPEYYENDDRWYCSVDFSVREGCDGDKLFDLLFRGEE